MDFLQLAKARYSLRKYSDKPVEPAAAQGGIHADGTAYPAGGRFAGHRHHLRQAGSGRLGGLCKKPQARYVL